MSTVYLETSFISACVSTRDDPASIYRRESSGDWWHTQRDKHDLFISAEVLAELSSPRFPQSDRALELVDDIGLLEINQDVTGLAGILVAHRVMPAPVAGDAIHVAAATIWGIEYMLSWNVRHLANPNKTTQLLVICRRMGLTPPQIVTPESLWEY